MMATDPTLRHVMYFKNSGTKAGASLERAAKADAMEAAMATARAEMGLGATSDGVQQAEEAAVANGPDDAAAERDDPLLAATAASPACADHASSSPSGGIKDGSYASMEKPEVVREVRRPDLRTP